MEELLCLSYMLAVGGESLVRDLVFNGCRSYRQLISSGYLRVVDKKVYLTLAGLVALQRGLPRGSWWLVGYPRVEVGCPFVEYGDVVVAPFSWILWERFSGSFSEAFVVKGFRAGARVWKDKYARRPFESLYKARELLEKAMEVYVAGGNKVYVEKIVDEAWKHVKYSCDILGARCVKARMRDLGGGIVSLLRLVDKLMGSAGTI